MHFTSALSALIPVLLAAAAAAVPAGPAPLDVFAPPITFPTAGTVWASEQDAAERHLVRSLPLPAPPLNGLARDASGAPFILAKGFSMVTMVHVATKKRIWRDNWDFPSVSKTAETFFISFSKSHLGCRKISNILSGFIQHVRWAPVPVKYGNGKGYDYTLYTASYGVPNCTVSVL
ncbi:hypothetical protein B0H17DRAFT_1186794 [Mycena rosella]|uniref:Uncharacterized protein n=1 Tax=Mycena rosella TaxID=1033263 RepID=A0AAD7FVS6_MYCRO|nr:hypothetical protein B0H17DRAFT_1186794 [Mycena rosella]